MMRENKSHVIDMTNQDLTGEGAPEKKVTIFLDTRAISNQQNISNSHQDSRVEGTPEKKVAPEKKVTTFAITMSVLDLVSIVLRMLELYLVVQKINMGVMIKSTIVFTLVLEGIRILCRTRGLELNHMCIMKQLPLSIHIISWLFYYLHLFSVLASGVLSTVQLVSLDFGKTNALLVLFYVVAILDAMVILAAMAIWIWKVSHGRLFEIVQDECGLGNLNLDIDPTRKFFYDAYYKCVTGHILEPKMNFITIAKELIDSTSNEKQFMGARILEKLSTHEGLSEATLDKILTSKDSKVIERLINILIYKNTFKEDVRRSAAKIVFKLVEKEPNVKQHYPRMEEAMEEVMELENELLKNVEGDQCSEDVEKDSSTRAL